MQVLQMGFRWHGTVRRDVLSVCHLSHPLKSFTSLLRWRSPFFFFRRERERERRVYYNSELNVTFPTAGRLSSIDTLDHEMLVESFRDRA